MKNIAIDCRALVWERSGIARYLANILQVLFILDQENTYYLLSQTPLTIPYNQSNVHSVVMPGNIFSYKFLHTPRFLRKKKIDVYWSPTQELPLQKVDGCRYVMSMHDIANELHKDWVSWNIRLMTYMGLYNRSAQIADNILAVTESVKKDITSYYRLNPEKISVTYEGYDPLFKTIEKKTAKVYIKNNFNINNDYIFYINTVQSENLVEAFAKLKKNEWKDKKISLVCLGKFVVEKQNPLLLAKKFDISESVITIEKFITDQDVNYLYSGSEFFISPSFYEGFGLTPLEALRSGASIAISNVPTHKEVFQDIPIYFNPLEVEDIKNAMFLLYKNEKEKKRMLANAAKLYILYTWKKVGEKVLAGLTRK